MGRRDRGLAGSAAPSLAVCLRRGTQRPQSVLPGLGWAACPSGSAPARLGPSLPTRGQRVVAGAGSRRVSRPAGRDGAGSPGTGPLRCGAGPLPQRQGFRIAPARGVSLRVLSPQTPCTCGVQGAGEPAPRTTAVQGRPRETSRRKEPPGLRPPGSRHAAHTGAGRRCHRSGSGGERGGQAQEAAVFPQPRLPSKSNIVGTRQAPCAGSAYTGLS